MATFVNDTCTDTDGTVLSSHTGETGATWTKSSDAGAPGTLTINTNRVTHDNSTSTYVASGTPAGADYDVEADIVFLSQTGAVAIMGRRSFSASHDSGYLFRHQAFQGWRLYRMDGGALTQLGTTTGAEFTTGTKHAKLEMRGTAIKGYVDGSLVVDGGTDATYGSAGQVALYTSGNGSSSTSYAFDNVSATDAASGRGLFQTPSLSGIGIGGSFFRDPLQGARA